MKSALLFLSVCLLSYSSAFAQAQKKQSDLQSDNVKGNVKQITQKYMEAGEKDGKDTIGNQYEATERNYEMHYNSSGYISWATFYKTGRTLDYRYTFKYDIAGNQVSSTRFPAISYLNV